LFAQRKWEQANEAGEQLQSGKGGEQPGERPTFESVMWHNYGTVTNPEKNERYQWETSVTSKRVKPGPA